VGSGKPRRGYTAADLALSPPAFLAQAFQGDSRALRLIGPDPHHTLPGATSPEKTKEEEEAEDDELIEMHF